MLLENAPSVEYMEKGLCFLLKHRNIIATAYWILLLKPSFVISQGQTCWHTFRALMSAKNKRPIKCMKPKFTPLYFHSSHAWYTWLLYYKIQQFFLECVRMHEYNNNIAFPSHSSIHTAILNIHCFFFPLVYIRRNDVYILIQPLSLYYICHDKSILLFHWNFQNRPFYLNKSSYTYVRKRTNICLKAYPSSYKPPLYLFYILIFLKASITLDECHAWFHLFSEKFKMKICASTGNRTCDLLLSSAKL